MPTYKYKCNYCHKIMTKIHKITECDKPVTCIYCGNDCSRIFIYNEGGFILNGPGFYKKGGFPGKSKKYLV